MGAAAAPKISVEEYLARDRAAELKSEYYDGQVVPIVTGSLRRGMIAANVAASVAPRLQDGVCRLAVSPIRVQVSSTKFVYPDALVVCGKPALADEYMDTLTNPKVIIEILSPSTNRRKVQIYGRLASFEEYVLISQDQALVEVFHRTGEEEWNVRFYAELSRTVNLQSLGISIPMAELYSGIELREE